jgi:S-DNA-T family DNA segregation ATPase FtsK/SpoIIIE
VLTADRRAALPPVLSSTIPTRVLLRLANVDEFSTLGMRPPEGFEKAPPGRCWVSEGEVQMAVLEVTGDASGAAQTQALQQLAANLPPPDSESAPAPVRLLPEVVAFAELPAPEQGSVIVPVGIDEGTLQPVTVDLSRDPFFLVTGPPGSGRTTTLRTLVRGLRAARPDSVAYLLGTRRSSLFDEPWWEATGRGPDQAEQLARSIADSLADRDGAEAVAPTLLVIDDADDLTDGMVASTLEDLLGKGRDAGLIGLVAMTSFKAERAYTNWVQVLRHERNGVILRPDAEETGDVLYVRLPKRAGLVTPPGRGYLASSGSVTLIQVAS